MESFKEKLIVLLIIMLSSSAVAVEKPNTIQKTCITSECHADYSKKSYVHGPVGLGDCASCHESKDAESHTFEFARKGRDLCEYCHLDQMVGKNIHEPLKTGDCIQCHVPHSSDNKFLLPENTVAELCENCHQTLKGLKYLHGPVAVGECTICHNSHGSDHESLLNTEPSELCFSCHVVTKNQLHKFEYVHEPAQNDCIGCHNSHGADNAMMLKAETPELCYPWHENIKKISTDSKYKHSVVGKKGGCLQCHTPHASTVQYGLKDDPATLCMTCHDKPVGINKDEVLKSFSDEIDNKKFMHGPVAQKDCKGCHLAHGSDHYRLLAKNYPSEFYAPYDPDNYELCFSCHPESLARTEETRNLTDFRNGSLNLHYLHVNKAVRGRTCRSCHETHASNLPKHIRKSVPYGMWELPIKFTKTDQGGSCSPGCHLPAEYNRKVAVDYSAPPKTIASEKSVAAEKPVEAEHPKDNNNKSGEADGS